MFTENLNNEKINFIKYQFLNKQKYQYSNNKKITGILFFL